MDFKLVSFQPFQAVLAKSPSAVDCSAILAAVLEHRVALLEEWERKVC